MASPPFNIDQTLPADNGIVSQHPAAARTMRDVVESWLLVNHNTNGRHDEVQFDHKADPAAPGAALTEIWASSTGAAAGVMKVRIGAAGTTAYLGVPPGVVAHTASAAAPVGWALANGQAILRAGDGADLFALIGTGYGAGNGSTTYNLPNVANKVIAGIGSGTFTTLGATVGAETINIARNTLPNEQLDVQINAGAGAHDHDLGDGFDASGTVAVTKTTSDRVVVEVVNNTGGGRTGIATLPTMTGFTNSLSGGGAQQPFSLVQSSIVLTAIIKL